MNNFVYLIIGHMIGDFYLQSNSMFKQNKVLKHSFIYSISVLFMLSLSYITNSTFTFSIRTLSRFLVYGLILFGSHYLVDSIKFFIEPKMLSSHKSDRFLKSFGIFIIDQLIHILVLLLVYYCWYGIFPIGKVSPGLMLVLSLLFLIMPASIIISKTLSLVTGEEGQGFVLDDGSLIGIMERLLIFFLAISNSAEGIGFIIAAKTMVRYGEFEKGKQIEETHESYTSSFRVKYLIGTMTSVLLSVLVFIIYSMLT